MKINFKLPIILRSKIADTIQKEIDAALARKEKEYERLTKINDNNNRIEKESLIQKYTDMIEKDAERYKEKLDALTLEKDNEIRSLEQENDNLYKRVIKFQDTYSSYLFKLNDLRKRVDKVFSFVNGMLKQTTSQFQEIVKLKDEIEQELEEENKQKEVNSKALSFK